MQEIRNNCFMSKKYNTIFNYISHHVLKTYQEGKETTASICFEVYALKWNILFQLLTYLILNNKRLVEYIYTLTLKKYCVIRLHIPIILAKAIGITEITHFCLNYSVYALMKADYLCFFSINSQSI